MSSISKNIFKQLKMLGMKPELEDCTCDWPICWENIGINYSIELHTINEINLMVIQTTFLVGHSPTDTELAVLEREVFSPLNVHCLSMGNGLIQLKVNQPFMDNLDATTNLEILLLILDKCITELR